MSSNLVYVNGLSIDRLTKNLDKLGDDMPTLTNRILGNLGSEGRRVLGAKELLVFKLGAAQSKWKSSKKGGGRWYNNTVFSHANDSHGYFQTSSVSNPRMIGFAFENKAVRKKGMKTQLNMVATGHEYSLLANLFYKPVHYSKNSPFFRRSGEKKFGRYQEGYTRGAKISMQASDIQSAIQPTIERTNRDIDEILRKRGLL